MRDPAIEENERRLGISVDEPDDTGKLRNPEDRNQRPRGEKRSQEVGWAVETEYRRPLGGEPQNNPDDGQTRGDGRGELSGLERPAYAQQQEHAPYPKTSRWTTVKPCMTP